MKPLVTAFRPDLQRRRERQGPRNAYLRGSARASEAPKLLHDAQALRRRELPDHLVSRILVVAGRAEPARRSLSQDAREAPVEALDEIAPGHLPVRDHVQAGSLLVGDCD